MKNDFDCDPIFGVPLSKLNRIRKFAQKLEQKNKMQFCKQFENFENFQNDCEPRAFKSIG